MLRRSWQFGVLRLTHLQDNHKFWIPYHRTSLMWEIIPYMLQKTMECFVLSALANCATIAVAFDLWIPCTGVDTICLVVNFIDWEPRHITIGIFEASDIAGATLAVIVKR